MMDKRILLTMGMVAYNEEKYIAEAIESLLAQTFKDFILIISDNASTDKTQQICESYAKKDKRIVYVRHEKNKGSLFNFSYVLEQAKTPYFMWCGGHDIWHPCFAEKLLLAFEDKNIVLSYPESEYINMDGLIQKTLKDDYTTTNIEKPVDRYLYILRNYKVPNIFHGIWQTKVLKNCDVDLKTPTRDIIIIEQGAFEGKFLQYKEVLFWLRIIRPEEKYGETIRRQISAAKGKPVQKINVFSIRSSYMIYTAESIKIVFRKRYSLPVHTKIWLVINIIYYKYVYTSVVFVVGLFLEKLLPQKTFLKLKEFWHRHEKKN